MGRADAEESSPTCVSSWHPERVEEMRVWREGGWPRTKAHRVWSHLSGSLPPVGVELPPKASLCTPRIHFQDDPVTSPRCKDQLLSPLNTGSKHSRRILSQNGSETANRLAGHTAHGLMPSNFVPICCDSCRLVPKLLKNK